MGYPPDLGWGTPQTLDGVPPQTWDRVHPQTWDGVPPRPGMGYSPDLGWGIPPGPGMGYLSPTRSGLRGGRCASCVHAGRLSCLTFFGVDQRNANFLTRSVELQNEFLACPGGWYSGGIQTTKWWYQTIV